MATSMCTSKGAFSQSNLDKLLKGLVRIKRISFKKSIMDGEELLE
jgi:hypothetical protein